MEKLINKICGCMPNNCTASREEKVVTKQETPVLRQAQNLNEEKKAQKPWSVFEDVYWI